MTLPVADGALLLPLITFSIFDAQTRTLPLWLTGSAFVLAVTGWLCHLWPWHPLSALLALGAFFVAGLPGGDQKGIAVCAGFLTAPYAAVAVLLALGLGLGLMGLGRVTGWSTIFWPFFPWCAGAVLAVRMLA